MRVHAGVALAEKALVPYVAMTSEDYPDRSAFSANSGPGNVSRQSTGQESPIQDLPRQASSWSLNLVAKWCEERAKQTEDRRLLKRIWARYAKGSLLTPYERFAMAVQSEVDEKTEFWMHMAKTVRDKADEKLSDGNPTKT